LEVPVVRRNDISSFLSPNFPTTEIMIGGKLWKGKDKDKEKGDDEVMNYCLTKTQNCEIFFSQC